MKCFAELDSELGAGLEKLGFPEVPEQRARLLGFMELLRRWGKIYNLTAVDKPEEMLRRHLLDSLAVAPHLNGRKVLDVGTGAGLPGIPLAVMFPERSFTLLDRSAKKVRFVVQASAELGLKNVRAEQRRVEDFRESGGRYDTILVRAFGSLREIWALTHHLLDERGVILAMKGRLPEAELAELSGVSATVIRLDVPGLEAERHLIALQRPS